VANAISTPYSRLRMWIYRTIRLTGDRLFAAADAEAESRGWQVRRTRSGLGRSYRDPRFDLLVRCPDCGGRGVRSARWLCSECHGTGRLNLAERSPRAGR